MKSGCREFPVLAPSFHFEADERARLKYINLVGFRRTFPPTDSELPTSSSSSPSSDSKISSDAIPTAVEPQATPNPNNLTPLDEHTTEDWEKVEKPEDIPAAVQPSELSDEGVEVDAVNSDLGVSEVASETGKEEDKNEEKGEGKTHSYGLLKDW